MLNEQKGEHSTLYVAMPYDYMNEWPIALEDKGPTAYQAMKYV